MSLDTAKSQTINFPIRTTGMQAFYRYKQCEHKITDSVRLLGIQIDNHLQFLSHEAMLLLLSQKLDHQLML